MKWQRLVSILCLSLYVAGCAHHRPSNINDACQMLKEKRQWYKRAKKSEKRWGSSVSTMLAIIHQESAFNAKARPPRKKWLGFIPGPRKSDAYGYAQAKKSTWRWYQKSTGKWGARRDKFSHAIDFVGWYNAQSAQKNKIKLNNTYALYLAYHEGHGGFSRGSFRKKAWLQKVAKKVESRARRYQEQIHHCRRKK